MGEELTNPWKDRIGKDDFQSFLKEFQSEEEFEEEEEEEEIQGCPSDPLLEFVLCDKCEKLVPLKSFENHVTYTKECRRLRREQKERENWDEIANKKNKGKTVPVGDEEAEYEEEEEDEEEEDEEEEDEEVEEEETEEEETEEEETEDEETEDETSEEEDEEEDEPQTIYSEEWVRRFERLSLPTELNKDYDPPKCSETPFASLPYYIHIHCGVMKSGEPCKYFMTSCPIHNPREKMKVPSRNFIEDYYKLKSAFEKILSQPKELNIKFCCGLLTEQGTCTEFLFSCNHLLNIKREARQEDILKLIQGLIEIDPSLKKHYMNYQNAKRRKNHLDAKSLRRLKTVIISDPCDDKKHYNDSHMEMDDSVIHDHIARNFKHNDSTVVFSSSFAPMLSNNKKFCFQKFNLECIPTPQPVIKKNHTERRPSVEPEHDFLWKTFGNVLNRTLQKDMLTLTNSDDDSEESWEED